MCFIWGTSNSSNEQEQMSLPVVVGVDTDERISELKGPTRPVNTLKNRVEFLRSIKYIDEVVVFSTDEELEEAIHSRMPRYMLIGDDYREKEIIGSEWIKEVIYVPRYEGLSLPLLLYAEPTTNIYLS